MPMTHISDEMRAAIGIEMDREVSFPISESDIRRWAIAVYYPAEPPRLYWDAEYAKNTVDRFEDLENFTAVLSRS